MRIYESAYRKEMWQQILLKKWKIFKIQGKKNACLWKMVGIDLLKLDLFKIKKEKLKN